MPADLADVVELASRTNVEQFLADCVAVGGTDGATIWSEVPALRSIAADYNTTQPVVVGLLERAVAGKRYGVDLNNLFPVAE